MLETLRNALKIKDIRSRIAYTFVMLIIIRIGSQLPIPGVNTAVFSAWFAAQTANGMGFFDALTGGSFYNMSIFALNVSPYITSSIIIQLLTIAIPALEEMQKDGEDGRKKIASITRYVTVALAVIESTAMTIGFSRAGYLVAEEGFSKVLMYITIVLTLTAGSTAMMWIGERITENGVGNGISIILAINIISRMPSDFASLYDQFIAGKSIQVGILAAVIILAIVIGMVFFVVLLQGGVRKIPVQYSKKIQGRKQVGGQSTHIPLKVNTAGVIPVIFAQSLLQTPVIIAGLLGKGNGDGIGSQILKVMNQQYWCNPEQPIYTIGLFIYIALLIAFAYFYTSITFNPLEIANNMKKAGGFIPGIRPGKPTSDYLNKILNYIVFIGAIGLMIIAVAPIVFSGLFGASVSFAGTSLIIVVGVIIETLKQIESQMLVRYYKGFLND